MPLIKFLGGCREVGRSAVLIESNNGTKFLLDYGVRFSDEDRLPYSTDLSNLKGIALSHCHIDHSGGIPSVYKNVPVPLFTNPITMQLTEILLRDMIKISRYPYQFGFRELELLRQNATFLETGIRQRIDADFFITFFNAGHIPGSVSVLLEVDKKNILYTGDINTMETNLVKSAEPQEIPEIDVLITESTYALKEHPLREELELKFVEDVFEAIEDEGNVLIPAFGVARSQEILLILEKYNFRGDIFIDGLSRKICNVYSEFPESLKNFKDFKQALKNVHFVRNKERKKITSGTSNVIISPSGMLKGGAALNYIKNILREPNCAVYFVGYQVEGTPGQILLDDKYFEFNNKTSFHQAATNLRVKADCKVNYYDFSSHADNALIQKYIDALKFQNDSKFVFCMHGDEKATTALAKDLSLKGINSVAPEAGEIYRV